MDSFAAKVKTAYRAATRGVLIATKMESGLVRRGQNDRLGPGEKWLLNKVEIMKRNDNMNEINERE